MHSYAKNSILSIFFLNSRKISFLGDLLAPALSKGQETVGSSWAEGCVKKQKYTVIALKNAIQTGYKSWRKCENSVYQERLREKEAVGCIELGHNIESWCSVKCFCRFSSFLRWEEVSLLVAHKGQRHCPFPLVSGPTNAHISQILSLILSSLKLA